MKILVEGAGGLIGGHMVNRLVSDGYDVYATDIKAKSHWGQVNDGATNLPKIDLSQYKDARQVSEGMDRVFLLAANMGGIGFIETQPLECILSVDISSACLRGALDAGVSRVFYSSSACAYPVNIQTDTAGTALKESDMWRGRPEYGYGEEKGFTESMCEIFNAHTCMETRVARYHNIYGLYGEYEGGREKAPAAICRKVAEAVISGKHEIEIWGNGEQSRSFCWVEDCVDGSLRLMNSGYDKPLNIGSDELVTINELVSVVEDIAGVKLKRNYDLSAPQGVAGRNSDNTLIKEVLNFEPSTSLVHGLQKLYPWVEEQLRR